MTAPARHNSAAAAAKAAGAATAAPTPMATCYNFRIMTAQDHVEDRHTCHTLARTVKSLSRASGISWPYQVIHRALKQCSAWAEAYTPAGESVAMIAVIERDADSTRRIQVWSAHSAA